LNIKEIELSSDVETFNDHYLILNFRNAGRVLKGDVQKMKEALENTLDSVMEEYVKAFDNGRVKVEGFEEFDSDLFVKNSKPKQEFILETADGMTVVLDTTLNEELINEGILREIIRNAQVLRKEADFNIDDRIEIYISSKDKTIANILNENKEKIMSETLAISFGEGFVAEISRDIDVDGKLVHYELKRK
jgi:isoleucyl-tRNA synthetase